MAEILRGDRLGLTTEWIDVRSAKKATLEAVAVSGDATLCDLTVQESVDGLGNGVNTATTLGTITALGVNTDAFSVDGIAYIRAKITTASTSASMVRVAFGIQKEV